MTKTRKTAIILGISACIGSIGIASIVINVGTFKGFLEVLPQSAGLFLTLMTGLISLVITLVLLSPIGNSKRFQLASLVTVSIIFVVSAIKMTVTLLLVLLWQWYLYKLYKEA